MPKGFKENVAHEHDILGRMVQSEMPQEKKDGSIQYQKTTTGYDTTGNVTEKEEQIDGDRTAKTEYTYDKQGNLVMVKSYLEGDKELESSSAQYVQYVYDIQRNKVRQFTGMTAPLTLIVSEVTDATDDADTFSYAGKTYQLTVSGTKKTDTVAETKYEYDGKNQLLAYTDPEGRRETYTYDVNSNLMKTVDKNGNTQKNTYDYQNRLTEMVAKERKTGEETKHTYTYNAYGDVATLDDTSFAYEDASGQVTKETTKLTSVTDEKGNKVVDYDYDADGNLSERTVPGNNMTTTYTYDYQNHLTAMKNQTGSAGVISQYTSEYLANGQKSKETSDIADKEGRKTKKTASYTYDLLGRITKETKTGSEVISYTYDSNNNRKEMRVRNKVTAYKYNKNDELLRTDTLNTDTKEDSVVIYKNDKNGNQLATVNCYDIPSDKKDSTYIDIDVTLGDNRLNENVVNHYNAENQLIQALTKNYKVSFTYDAEGLRTSKTVNEEKTVFVWDGDQLVMELSDSGKVQKRYIRGNGLVYADEGNNTQKQYYVTDPYGNVVQLTDESGKVIKTYEYDSFGNQLSEGYNPSQNDDNPWRFDGQYFDAEMQTYYMINRHYNSKSGRFTQEDPIRYEDNSGNYYTYAGNDPINYHDPDGLKVVKKIGNRGWCWLWDNKSYKGGRTIKFSKKSDPNKWGGWNSCESPDGYISIDPNADDKIINKFKKSKYNLQVTKKGHRYAVAVGPVVLSKKFSNFTNKTSDGKSLAKKFHQFNEVNNHFNNCYGKKLDAEIKKGGKKYYIHCVAGDTKEHTYPYGTYQTDVSYEKVYRGTVSVNAKGNPDTPSVIEFIGNVLHKNSALNKYTISKVIVYDKKRI